MKTLLTAALVALAVVGLIFGWFYLYGPCGTKVVEKSVPQLQNAGLKYVHAFQIASLASKTAFSGSISNLQKIERTTKQLKVPACLRPAKAILVKGMQEGIDGITASSRQSTAAREHINSSVSLLDSGARELTTISECAPFCITNRGPASPKIGELP